MSKTYRRINRSDTPKRPDKGNKKQSLDRFKGFSTEDLDEFEDELYEDELYEN